MNILVTGAKGQLGTELLKCLENGGTELGKLRFSDYAFKGIDFDELDISKAEDVFNYIKIGGYDVVINCAAMTNVDKCETEQDAAYLANSLGVRNLAIACEEVSAKFLHVSTDYVFGGDESLPRREWDRTNPQSVYGASKLLGERYAAEFCTRYFIVRTAWLYGYTGGNFVKTMLRVMRENGRAKVVDDQRGNPTNAADLAHHILKLLPTRDYGVYHGTGSGECSWYGFTKKIAEFSGIDAEITPCTTAEFPRPAKRPAYSSLDNMAFRSGVGDEFRGWEDALRSFLQNYDKEGNI
ncbi:NAD(P)-dependent oxidoreductase [Clostridia bacterium]|nr:NAD(P)-dependent oxidoreductase [Clostridia bacterium]